MIKTLRITSVIAVILAGIFLVFSVVFGVRSDEGIEKVLSSPGLIEQFKKTRGRQAKDSEDEVSPLVQQAEAFALYLSPPKPQTVKPAPGRNRPTIQPDLAVTPKFKVLATCRHEGRPELSQVLIDEPGKGRHWVRQSSRVGHLFIEEVKDGLVVVKSSEETFERMLEQKPETAPVGAAPPVSTSTRAGGQSRVKPALPALGRSAASVRAAAGAPRTVSKPPQPPRSAEDDAKMQELVDRLRGLRKSSKSDKTNSGPSDEERAAQIEELISKFKSSRVGAAEAKRLGNLGKTLNGAQEDPNRSQPAPTDEGKVEASPSKQNGSAEE
ncbi:MAG: hypothetical protein PVJ86_03240 [Phycisphaerales bacterium]|jgi:hypothetical protein